MPAPTAPANRPPLRRLAIVLVVWLAVAGGAVFLANALDSPVGEGARDAAQPAVPGPVATPDPDASDLPPLALVLDRPPPAAVTSLPPVAQVERLRARAASSGAPRRHVELGSALQSLGDTAGARAAFQEALATDPDDVGARVGLVLADGPTPEGSRRLAVLARERPRDQLVSFNTGWLEIYRGRGEPARRALARTVAVDPSSRLGRLAAGLLGTLGTGAGGRNP